MKVSQHAYGLATSQRISSQNYWVTTVKPLEFAEIDILRVIFKGKQKEHSMVEIYRNLELPASVDYEEGLSWTS